MEEPTKSNKSFIRKNPRTPTAPNFKATPSGSASEKTHSGYPGCRPEVKSLDALSMWAYTSGGKDVPATGRNAEFPVSFCEAIPIISIMLHRFSHTKLSK